jgi:hypothetical protein
MTAGKGNHELYDSEVAYQTYNDFSKFWGEKYLTSNVEIFNPDTNTWEYIGQTHRYFTTTHGELTRSVSYNDRAGFGG